MEILISYYFYSSQARWDVKMFFFVRRYGGREELFVGVFNQCQYQKAFSQTE